MKTLLTLVAAALLGVAGCAARTTGPVVPAAAVPSVGPFDDIRELAIVPYGSDAITVAEQRSEPGRTFDEVLSWYPYGAAFRPLAKIVHQAINSLLDADREAALTKTLSGVDPRAVVAEAMARRLRGSGAFEQVRTLSSEPRDPALGSTQGIVRVTVSGWGLVRVRSGDPDLLSSFTDVGGSLSIPGTGITLWDYREDVTWADQLPSESFKRDPQLARQQMLVVLERAGERLAAELLYARGPRP